MTIRTDPKPPAGLHRKAVPDGLAALLERHGEEIRARWVDRLREQSGSHYQMRSRQELWAWTGDGLTATVESLRLGSTEPLEDHAEEVSRARSAMGFKIDEVVQGILLLKEAALPHLLALPRQVRAEAIACLDRHLRFWIAAFAARFAQRLHDQTERLTALEERQRLAHELHDSVTQSLYGVTMYSEAANRLLDAGNGARAGELLRQLRDTSLEALREMRLLVFELRPPLLEKEGLIAALQARLAAVEGRAGLKTHLEVSGVGRLRRRTEEGLHGICKEALNNALKHARASRISVRLARRGEQIVLEIADDGEGFDPATAPSGGLGLLGMRERAEELDGSFSLTSSPGAGTRVRVEVPFEPRPTTEEEDERGSNQGTDRR